MTRDCPIHGVRTIMCDASCDKYASELLRSHACIEHAYTSGDEPRPNGEITLTLRCGVCGRKISSGVDRVLP